MKIAIVAPHIFMWDEIIKNSIFAPGLLAIKLANGLCDLGHDVSIYTAGHIRTKANVIEADLSAVKSELSKRKLNLIELIKNNLTIYKKLFKTLELEILSNAYKDASNYDILHIYITNGPEGPIFSKTLNTPNLFTLHDPFKFNFANNESRKLIKNVNFTSISNSQAQKALQLNILRTIYNGIDFSQFKYNGIKEDYFACYGRIIEQKGVHHAIDVCLKTNNKLKIAGLHYEGHGGSNYWSTKIKPFIDNKNIKYKGFLKKQSIKNSFLGKAKALLFPIEWDEPFGLAIIEANACGTPVIAFKQGSIPEVIKNGINGFIVKNKNEMINAMKKVDSIDRVKCRNYARKNFSIEKMVKEYERVYKSLTH